MYIYIFYYFLNYIIVGVGSFDLTCQTWRPLGTSQQELSRRFVGGVPRLYDWSTLYKNAFNERTYVTSVGSGTVWIIYIYIIYRFILNSML